MRLLYLLTLTLLPTVSWADLVTFNATAFDSVTTTVEINPTPWLNGTVTVTSNDLTIAVNNSLVDQEAITGSFTVGPALSSMPPFEFSYGPGGSFEIDLASGGEINGKFTGPQETLDPDGLATADVDFGVVAPFLDGGFRVFSGTLKVQTSRSIDGTQTIAGITLNGSSVPEPSAFFLLATMIGCLALVRFMPNRIR